MDGLWGKTLWKLMIWGYHHLRKHPNTSLKLQACRRPSPSWSVNWKPMSPRYRAARLAVALNCRKSKPSLQSVESVKTSARVTCGHPDVVDVPSAIFAWQCHSLGTCFFGWGKMEKQQRSLRIRLKSYQFPGPKRKVIFQLPTIHFQGICQTLITYHLQVSAQRSERDSDKRLWTRLNIKQS